MNQEARDAMLRVKDYLVNASSLVIMNENHPLARTMSVGGVLMQEQNGIE